MFYWTKVISTVPSGAIALGHTSFSRSPKVCNCPPEAIGRNSFCIKGLSVVACFNNKISKNNLRTMQTCSITTEDRQKIGQNKRLQQKQCLALPFFFPPLAFHSYNEMQGSLRSLTIESKLTLQKTVKIIYKQCHGYKSVKSFLFFNEKNHPKTLVMGTRSA